MSRIGLKPVILPEGVTAAVDGSLISVKGPKGELSVAVPSIISVEVSGNVITLKRHNDEIVSKTLHGTTRANLANAVKGVHEGFVRKLEISGIGYRCALRGKDLVLNVGFSHEVVLKFGDDVKVTCPDETHIVVEGIDKQKVGQAAALIHDTKRPEPYGGKGIKYEGERIIRKEGKRAAAGGKK